MRTKNNRQTQRTLFLIHNRMELLIGAVLSLLMEGFKKVADKCGREVTKQVIYITLFVATIAWTVLTRESIISQTSIEYVLSILAASVATYEVVIKNIQAYLTQDKQNGIG